jgi:hypothetical protein
MNWKTYNDAIQAEAAAQGVELTDKQHYTLFDAIKSYTDAAVLLQRYAQDVADNMYRAITECDAAMAFKPCSINSNGIAHQRGNDVDRMCAVLYDRSNAYAAMCYVLGIDAKKMTAALAAAAEAEAAAKVAADGPFDLSEVDAMSIEALTTGVPTQNEPQA